MQKNIRAVLHITISYGISSCADGSSLPFSNKIAQSKKVVEKATTFVTGMKFLQKAAINGKRLSNIKNSSGHFKSQESEMSCY